MRFIPYFVENFFSFSSSLVNFKTEEYKFAPRFGPKRPIYVSDTRHVTSAIRHNHVPIRVDPSFTLKKKNRTVFGLGYTEYPKISEVQIRRQVKKFARTVLEDQTAVSEMWKPGKRQHSDHGEKMWKPPNRRPYLFVLEKRNSRATGQNSHRTVS